MKQNKNLGENRKESQLPSKSGGCNEIQGFRGNCDSQGKLGMCPSLAEPDSGGFPRSEVSNYEPQATKSFLIQQFFKNVGEVWASSPHLRSKLNFAICFSCCNCTFWNLPIRYLIVFMKQVANSDKATGQLQHAGRQKQGWNPLLPNVTDRFL